ncbi:MAG: phosphoribosyl-AMP cyclohydrolase [Candidatus Bathyarchaeia archaeon]
MRLSQEEAREIAGQLNYRHRGLINVVAQDAYTNEVLMVAFANAEAVEKTLTSGEMHYWSTERNRLWKKGETSGHYQRVVGVYVDCDMDCLLVKVEQVGGACHLGYKSCFFRQLKDGEFKTVAEVVV